jgi:hypothetical protein
MMRATDSGRVLALLLALSMPTPSTAQLTSSVERLEVSIWPEYDRPEALVILKAWLPEEVPLPRYVALPMPIGATPNAVAKRDPNGQLLLAAHTIIDSDAGREVRIAADLREVRLEYYAPLVFDGDTRTYTFQWPGLLGFDSASWQIQQPVGAANLAVTPPPSLQETGFDGLTYLAGDIGPVAKGERFSIDLRYSKTSSQLTLAALQPPATGVEALISEPTEPPRSADVTVPPETGSFPWLIVLPVVLIAALIVVWFLQSGSDS